MGPSVVVVTDNDPDQFKSTGLLNWVRYSKNFLLLSVNPSGGGSTDFFTGSRGEEALFPFLFPGAPTGGPGSSLDTTRKAVSKSSSRSSSSSCFASLRGGFKGAPLLEGGNGCWESSQAVTSPFSSVSASWSIVSRT